MSAEEVSPERFRQAREYAKESGEDLEISDLAREIEAAVENDPSARTVQGAKALGFVSELRDRLEGDR